MWDGAGEAQHGCSSPGHVDGGAPRVLHSSSPQLSLRVSCQGCNRLNPSRPRRNEREPASGRCLPSGWASVQVLPLFSGGGSPARRRRGPFPGTCPAAPGLDRSFPGAVRYPQPPSRGRSAGPARVSFQQAEAPGSVAGCCRVFSAKSPTSWLSCAPKPARFLMLSKNIH